MDQEKEREHLRNIVEIFLLNTFPEKSYFRNNAVRYVIRELLVNGGIYYFHENMINNLLVIINNYSVDSEYRISLRPGLSESEAFGLYGV